MFVCIANRLIIRISEVLFIYDINTVVYDCK